MDQKRAIADLTPEELLGECIMPRLKIEEFVEDGKYAEGTRRLVREHKVGGFCVFGGSPESVANSVRELQELATNSHGIPLLFSIDCEFGLPMRLISGGTEFPDAMAIAETGEPLLAYRVGQAIAREMRLLGMNWNFAPVADVNSNPANPIINTRSFGESPSEVSRYALEYMRGLRDEGVAATAKHFPGHGDTSKDSHRELPLVQGGWDRFQKLELPPFCELIDAGVDSVMPGHLAAPDLAKYLGANESNSKLPATLSRTLVTDLLRERLGFKGVVVTDALDMHAITDLYGETEAMIRSWKAGVDILLLPQNPNHTYEALHSAYVSGRITEPLLRERGDRIGNLKRKYFLDPNSINPETLALYAEEHCRLAREVGEKALRVEGTVDISNATLLIISDDRTQAITKALKFKEQVAACFMGVRLVMINEWSEAESVDGNTVIATFHRARGYIDGVVKDVTMRSVVLNLAERLSRKGIAPRGLIGFGSPYLDAHFVNRPSFVIKTFSESAASVDAVSKLLSGTT